MWSRRQADACTDNTSSSYKDWSIPRRRTRLSRAAVSRDSSGYELVQRRKQTGSVSVTTRAKGCVPLSSEPISICIQQRVVTGDQSKTRA